eukprot:CAMPEP_0173421310 /NCGR_PEP_ID=MMETSP1357-20121228/2466_1 /TAXON_ID=77926 /ORGANISM="Hemiselmis rufescens, Strain PCC563" /LENGTH=715 /DNA_ID=CAMNT_0014384213 /DNA_START=46 /DNA_END=2193 /DNA_ORIENTATION=+
MNPAGMFKFLQKGVTDPSKSYVAAPRDGSLGALLHEAFKVLEMRFANFDHDNAETLMYKELERELSMMGFRYGDNLAQMFKQVDFDGSGTLDFSEFLALLYLWAVRGGGDYAVFFRHPTNAQVIKQAFEVMEKCMLTYDQDRSRQLAAGELDAFFQQQLPQAVQCGAYQRALDDIFPAAERQQGKEINFPKFMFMLYQVSCKMPGSTIKGVYTSKPKADPFAAGVGEKSALWQELRGAFQVLEEDFVRFDRNGDNMVDYTEITMGIPNTTSNAARLEILSRLEHAFSQVDIDQSRSLDFYEYMYLGFMMTQSGSYNDLVSSSTGSTIVKKCFINIHTYYRKYDEDGNLRLTWDEIQKFFKDLFGVIDPNLQKSFDKVKYQSSATQGRDAVDVVRLMKLLYMLICPQGKFHPSTYEQVIANKQPKANQVVTVHKAEKLSRPKRFTNVQVAKFQKGKLLGQGGQGTVHAGKYEGATCAGKTFLGTPDDDLVKECLDEVKFFMALDHPNCHYLLGAKTTLNQGGILVLTEICDNGSLFDMYCTKSIRFDPGTAFRIGRECALGFEEIHKIGYMHRDIKSLNVFMDQNMVAKVADFGMATPEKTSTQPGGTPQWMAPEVLSNLLGRKMVYDMRVDVYSYAVLLWEIFHCKVPYGDTGMDQMAIANAVFSKGIRPRMSTSCPPEIAKLICACWESDPNRRPSFKDVVARMDQIESTIPKR